MKVVAFVVVLAALAAAEEAAEVPVVAKAAEPAVQPALHAGKLAAVDPASLQISLFAASKSYHAAKRRYDQETVQRVLLGGPVMLTFADVASRKWRSYLFPDGLASIVGYTPEEIAPLTEFLTNGYRKSMLFLSALDSLLWNNKNHAPFDEMHVPSYYSLSKALSIAESDSPFPHVVLRVGTASRHEYDKLQLVGEMQVTTYGLRALEKKSSLELGNQQTVASVAVTHAVVQQNGTAPKVAAEVPVVAAAAVPAVQSVGVANQPLAAQAAQATLLDVQPAQLNRTAAPAAQPVVKPAAHTGSLTALDLSTLSYRLLTAPAEYNAAHRQLDQETVQRVLNGPVMVSFRYKPDNKQEQMQTFLFVKGLGDFTGFKPEDIAPLTRFVGNGQSKALLFLTAGEYLHLQEMSMPVSPTYVPSSYYINSALRIEESFTPFPQLMLLEESNRDFSQLKQVGKIEWGLRAA